MTIKAFRFNIVPTDATGGLLVTQHLAVNKEDLICTCYIWFSDERN